MRAADQPNPAELLAQARAGDPESAGMLLDLYRNYLTVLARLQIGQRLQAKVDAADLVQETICDAFRDFAQFRGVSECELMQWLRAILAHRVTQLIRYYYRTQARNLRLEQQLRQQLDRSSQALARSFVSPLTSPSEKLMRRENTVLLTDALECLPEHYRDVLIWRHVEGLGFAEVAQRMNRTEHSVKHLWARALEQLRDHLVSST